MWSTGAYGYLSDYLIWCGAFTSLIVHAWCVARFWPTDLRPRLRLVVGNFLVFVSLLGFVALGAESYLRFISTSTDAFGASLTAQRWFKAFPRLNSLSFRDDEWQPQKPAGVRRIAFVGDSFTYGWAIDDPRDRFTDLLHKRFDARAPGTVEVMNIAWLGWNTQEELQALEWLIPEYRIDEVVLCYLPNDIEPLLPVSEDFNPRRPRSRWLNTSTSFLIDHVYHRWLAPRRGPRGAYWNWLADGFNDPQIWERHSQALRSFAAICRAHGAQPRLAILPFIATEGERYNARAIHARLQALFAEQSVPVVDLLPGVQAVPPTELIVNRADPHPNQRAHRLFADAIWEAFYAGESGSGP